MSREERDHLHRLLTINRAHLRELVDGGCAGSLP